MFCTNLYKYFRKNKQLKVKWKPQKRRIKRFWVEQSIRLGYIRSLSKCVYVWLWRVYLLNKCLFTILNTYNNLSDSVRSFPCLMNLFFLWGEKKWRHFKTWFYAKKLKMFIIPILGSGILSRGTKCITQHRPFWIFNAEIKWNLNRIKRRVRKSI